MPCCFRKSLLKKESPELLPLLQNFQDNVKALLPLLALLKPSAKKRLPSSGASYLEASCKPLIQDRLNKIRCMQLHRRVLHCL